jgi:hypothetical protein
LGGAAAFQVRRAEQALFVTIDLKLDASIEIAFSDFDQDRESASSYWDSETETIS